MHTLHTIKKVPEYPIQGVAFFSLPNGNKQVLARANWGLPILVGFIIQTRVPFSIEEGDPELPLSFGSSE